MERYSLSALIGIGIWAASLGVAVPAASVPLTYNVVVTQSNAAINMGLSASMDVNPDFTELVPGGNEFPVGASLVGTQNTFASPLSRITADVGLPGAFDDGAHGIDFSALSIRFVNFPGTFTGFGSVPVPLDVTGSNFQLVAFSARVSTFDIVLDAPFSSPLTPTGNPDEWLWAGLANVRLVGTLEPIVSIPGQEPVTLGAFPFDQPATIPLAGTFQGFPFGTVISVGIPSGTLQNQDLSLPPIDEQLDLLGLGLVTGFFHMEDLVLADISTAVVYHNATPIPEPGTALLLGVGLAAIVVMRRRSSP